MIATAMLAIQLNGCGAKHAPEATRAPAAKQEVRPAPPPARNTATAPPTPLAPNASWIFASDLGDFHQVWLARFALSALPPPHEDALLPFANAIEFQGASWCVAPEEIEVLLLHPDGSATLTQGVIHPGPADARHERPDADKDALIPKVRSLVAGGDLATRIDGLRLLVTGPIVYSSDCMRCHDGPEGEIAGALLYAFTEIPDD